MKAFKKIFLTKITLACGFGTLFAVILLSGCDRTAGRSHPAYPAWKANVRRITKLPATKRYYTFEDADRQAVKIANQAGWKGHLAFPENSEQTINPVPGRWQWEKAVRLDTTPLTTPAIDITDNSFSADMWCRLHGPGSVAGPNAGRKGTLLAVNNGFWKGWRLTVSFPDGILDFEIARPRPTGAISLKAGEAVTKSTWHHVAVTWNGEWMRIYVDGLLTAEREHRGSYHAGDAFNTFRVGYVGNGFGSVKFDVAELGFYDRALSQEDVFRNACFRTDLQSISTHKIFDAHRSYRAGDVATASASYEAILRTTELDPHLISLVETRLALCLLRQGTPGKAVALFKNIAETEAYWHTHRWMAADYVFRLNRAGETACVRPEAVEQLVNEPPVPPEAERELRLKAADAYRRQDRNVEASRQYKLVLAMDGLPTALQAETCLELGQVYVESDQYDSARDAYARILLLPDVPLQYRFFARFAMAESHRYAGDWGTATAQFLDLEQNRAFPRHLRWAAGQKVARLKTSPRTPKPASAKDLIAVTQSRIKLHVARHGRPDGDGTEARPFRTLTQARNRIRELKHERGALPGSVEVVIEGGRYYLDEAFTLTRDDSGTPQHPVVYRAADGQEVRFSGGRRLENWRQVDDPDIRQRLPRKSRDEVMQTDLAAEGISRFPTQRPVGFRSKFHPVVELYCDGDPMQPARWPNSGFVHVAAVNKSGTAADAKHIVFQYEDERPEQWAEPRKAWMHGYWRHLWADHSLRIDSLSAADNRITTAHRPTYGVQSGRPYYYVNVLEELDQPGEWYLDRTTKQLFFYPPSPMQQTEAVLTVLNDALLHVDGTEHVTFENLTFEYGRSSGVILDDARNCTVRGCTVRNVAQAGIRCLGGRNNRVLDSDVYNAGRFGIEMRGGILADLTPGNHLVENCHVHHWARLSRAITPGILLTGVGNRASHNLLHDSPCQAIRIRGNDHLVEFNHVHDVVTESDDQGGFDTYRGYHFRGNVVRYNYWHDIGSKRPLGQAGVRLDGAFSGTVIYGNVFENCSRGSFGAVQLHAGKDNWVDNNLFVNCKYAVSFHGWDEAAWRKFGRWDTKRRLRDGVQVEKPPHITRYPTLRQLDRNSRRNHIWRNLVINCGSFFYGNLQSQNLARNYIVNNVPLPSEARGPSRFAAQVSSLAFPIFQNIPFEKIGLRRERARPGEE